MFGGFSDRAGAALVCDLGSNLKFALRSGGANNAEERMPCFKGSLFERRRPHVRTVNRSIGQTGEKRDRNDQYGSEHVRDIG